MALLDKAEFRRMSRERVALSDHQAACLLSKHHLGDLVSQSCVGGNFTNSVFECLTAAGSRFILKIQYRSGNQPLEADRDVTHLLKGILPVAPLCLLDNDRDVIPHPTMILSWLDGELAESVFEHTTHQNRLRLSCLLGEILAAIHAVPVLPGQVPDKPLFRLNGWREKVMSGLCPDGEFQCLIEGIDRAFYSRLQRLLDQAPDLHFEEDLRLVWGDPTFHNFRVRAKGDDIRLSGVFDFQTAGLGNPIFDRFKLDGNFARAQADGIYQHPAYLNACCDAYAARGIKWPRVSETERLVRDVILKANGPRWWWDAARVLPPFTVQMLTDVLDGLEWLKVNAV